MEVVNILLCEDEALFAVELRDRLRTFGHHVVGIAATGADALALAEKHRPDLALMDIRLKGPLSGIETASGLQARYEIPSIFLTAYADVETVERAREVSSLGYLVKPVNDRELRIAIEFGMAQHRMEQSLRQQIDDSRAGTPASERPDDETVIIEDPAAFALAVRMAELGNIIGGVSHHLNDWLIPLHSTLQALIDGGTLCGYEERQLRKVLEGCARQRMLVQRLQWASQSSSRELKMNSMQNLVNAAVSEAREKLQTDIELAHYQPLESIVCAIDWNGAVSAIKELIRNAEEATNKGGRITVSLDEEVIDHPEPKNIAAVPGRYAVITVRDTGEGIAPEEHEKIFQPFYTTRIAAEAPGLGLSVAYGVTHAHGGWITVDSRPGEGTTVRMYFPAVERRQHAAEERGSRERATVV